MQLALSKYLFKLLIAALDTPFIYLARDWNVTDRDWVGDQAGVGPNQV